MHIAILYKLWYNIVTGKEGISRCTIKYGLSRASLEQLDAMAADHSSRGTKAGRLN